MLLFINDRIIFYMNNCKPTFSHPRIQEKVILLESGRKQQGKNDDNGDGDGSSDYIFLSPFSEPGTIVSVLYIYV